MVSASEKRAALQRILDSDEFDGAVRLRSFLSYIVDKEIDGQRDKIIGKTILADVYKDGTNRASDNATVVRVDANRMRQRLESYYNKEGKDDPVRVSVDKGGYIPSFSRQEGMPDNNWYGRRTGAIATAFLSVALLSFAAAAWFLPRDQVNSSSSEVSPQARTALFENAPSKLMARNTAEEARELLFPATQLIRVSAALSMFEDVMQLDPNYYGGFAGASQASSILAALSPDASMRQQHFRNAMKYSDIALSLDATKAWSHSAAAFINFVARDFDEANKASFKALELEPNNSHSLEIDAVVALFSGDFERAIASADPSLHADRPGSGLPWRNALGNAYFHIGDYESSIKHLTDAIKVGEPVSEINTSHLIAAYQASGDSVKAAEIARAFEMSWPDSSISKVLVQIFENRKHAERVLLEMKNAGWTDPLGRLEIE